MVYCHFHQNSIVGFVQQSADYAVIPQPPKKKGGGKGGKDGAGFVIDGVSTTEMSHDQLQQFAFRLKEEIDREREERNFFQLERDKLQTFWEITRQQLEENRAELRFLFWTDHIIQISKYQLLIIWPLYTS